VSRFPSNPELEDKLIAIPSDDAARAVFVDWILEQGGSLGELPADLAEAEESGHLVVTRNKGFLHSAVFELEDTDGTLVGRLLELPQARLLTDLTISKTWDNNEAELQPVVDAMTLAGGSRSLIEFNLVDHDQDISTVHLGDLGALWPLLPNLRKLWLSGGSMTVGNILLPRLRSLEVVTGGLSGESARSFGEASFPELVSMSLHLGARDYGGAPSDEDLALLLAGEGIPRITSLGLVNDEYADVRVENIAGAAVLPRLTHLDLSMGCMTDAGAAVLLREAARFRHLTQLSVGENFLTEDMCARLREVYGDRVTGLTQQRVEDEVIGLSPLVGE
jgi:hypothetical protein